MRVKASEFEHGLIFKNFISVQIDVGCGFAKITVVTDGGKIEKDAIPFYGRVGNIFAEVTGMQLYNVKASWSCEGYSAPVYLFGDSYFHPVLEERWTSILISEGYKNNFMCGYPGMKSDRAIEEVRIAFKRGTPKYAGWCMGMNDLDDDEINGNWLAGIKEFIEICRANGTVPVLSTIPSIPGPWAPGRNHTLKNEWVETIL